MDLHGYNNISQTLALLSLANQVGFIFEGALLAMVVLYFCRYRKTDALPLQIIVGLSTVLELASTGILLAVNWRISSKLIDYFPVLDVCTAYSLRVPVQIAAQTFFGFRSWALAGKRKLLKEIWMTLLLAELILGELTLGYSIRRWSVKDPRPYPVGPLFTAQIFLTAGLNIAVASIFAHSLLGMRSGVRRTHKVLFQILMLSFMSNLVISTLTVSTALLWYYSFDAKFHIPLELLAKSYPIVLLSTLLSRDNHKAELAESNRIVNLDWRLDIDTDFVDRSYRRNNSSASSQSPKSPTSPRKVSLPAADPTI